MSSEWGRPARIAWRFTKANGWSQLRRAHLGVSLLTAVSSSDSAFFAATCARRTDRSKRSHGLSETGPSTAVTPFRFREHPSKGAADPAATQSKTTEPVALVTSSSPRAAACSKLAKRWSGISRTASYACAFWSATSGVVGCGGAALRRSATGEALGFAVGVNGGSRHDPRRPRERLAPNREGAMMTLDQAMDKAAGQIDALLEQRYRDLELKMFADGCTDFDGWRKSCGCSAKSVPRGVSPRARNFARGYRASTASPDG